MTMPQAHMLMTKMRGALVACLLLLALALPALSRVLVVGDRLRPAATAWQQAGIPTELLAARNCPEDAAALAARAEVLVVDPNGLSAAQQLAIESFVRGGGGLLVDITIGPRRAWSGSWLETLSPTIAVDERATNLVRIAPDAPRLAGGQNVSIPARNQAQLLNTLSAWTFSKPLWHDQWEEKAATSEPQGFAVLSEARYGAGRTAAWGAGNLSDAKLHAWPGFAAYFTQLFARLAAGGPVTPAAARAVALRGYTAPEWWATPLAGGLRGMGQSIGIDAFNLPPEALQEAGYIARPEAATVLLFGKEAAAHPGPAARVVLRAPANDTPLQQKAADAAAMPVVTPVPRVALVTAAGAQDVRLPHSLPKMEGALPAYGGKPGKPQVELPAKWRVAFTNDPDTDVDLTGNWAGKTFNDAGWEEKAVGSLTAPLFGKPAGFDGAIWYRGMINVAPEAATSDAALVIDPDAQHTRVYVDGVQVAVEPRKVLLPLAKIGPGAHLLAIRTYGEMRTNKGLKGITTSYLPLLWKPDPQHVGWAQGWMKPGTNAADWIPVNYDFGNDPAGKDALEGWLRFPVTVPQNAAPFALSIGIALNAEAIIFVNGTPVARQGTSRWARHVIPATAFVPGPNVVSLWVRYPGHEAKGISVNLLSPETMTYKTTVTAERDGLGLRAQFLYENAGTPLQSTVLVNGKVAGGFTSQNGPTVTVLAAGALHAGENDVEIRLSRNLAGAAGLSKLEVVAQPAEVARPVTGWMQLPRAKAGDNWCAPELDESAWTPTGTTQAQSYERSWETPVVPDLGNPACVYRGHLPVTAEELKQNLTLFLRGPAITRLIVNGIPITPDDEFYYSLNAALHAGDNVIAFAPDWSTYRGLNVMMPWGRDRGVFVPELRTDRAPLIPAHPALTAYRLNRTFPVAALAGQPGDVNLFTWPNGAPAVVARQVEGRVEIVAAPGLLAALLPAANLAVRAMYNGSANTTEYDYAQRINHDGLRGDRDDQLLSALLAVAEGRPAYLADLQVAGQNAGLTVCSTGGAFTGQVAWRILDWEGAIIASGTAPVTAGANQDGRVAIRLPDLADPALPEGAGFGRFVRLRVALLSGDRREVLAFLDRHVSPLPSVSAVIRLDQKIDRYAAQTGAMARRLLHESNEQLAEGAVYLPGETATVTAWLTNNLPAAQTVNVTLRAMGGLAAREVANTTVVKLPPLAALPVTLALTAADTKIEQPWRLTAEVTAPGQEQVTAVSSLLVAQPRGEVADMREVTKQGHGTGGYMWQMANHCSPLEHIRGTDAQPVPEGGPWWTKVRQGGDSNWIVAQGVHREYQGSLLWGPFYDQYRGEVGDSYGWFPNGQYIRQWWAPFAVRELWRTVGTRAAVFALSDWWQYDAGYETGNYATLQMFNAWLVANKGKTIAGQTLDGKPILAATMTEMLRTINTQYPRVFKYFLIEGLAECARYTGTQLDAAAPGTGTSQLGQGAFAGWLPGVPGGAALGPLWTKYENQGILDADNHPFAGDWQYALEGAVYRALAGENYLLTQWESPMRYHRANNMGVGMTPLDAAQWRRRLLDSRWQVAVDTQGRFQRVLNVTHNEPRGDDTLLLPRAGGANIGGGVLPYHWWIKDRLAPLAMTIGPAKPLSPLLVVGESDHEWRGYYGMLGRFRDAGLSFGGAVSIAQLDKLNATDIPALVWMPGREVDGQALAAIERKVKADVPLLLLTNVPATLGNGPDLRALLGVGCTEEPPAGPVTQAVGAAFQAWPEAHGVESVANVSAVSSYTALPGGMEAILTRAGRLAVGMTRGATRVVLYALSPNPWDADDSAAAQLAVRALDELMGHPIAWSAGTGGYAFQGLDGRLYLVVENYRLGPNTATIRLTQPGLTPAWRAADLLSGTPLTLRAVNGAVAVDVPLDRACATAIVLSPAP